MKLKTTFMVLGASLGLALAYYAGTQQSNTSLTMTLISIILLTMTLLFIYDSTQINQMNTWLK